MVYLVTWNINKAGAFYTPARNRFITGFKGLDAIYAGNLDTVVLVSTTLSAILLYNRLTRNLDKNDRIMVSRVVPGGYTGWVDSKVVAWLKARVH